MQIKPINGSSVFFYFALEEDCTRIRLKYHGTPTNAAIQELTKVELCNELDRTD